MTDPDRGYCPGRKSLRALANRALDTELASSTNSISLYGLVVHAKSDVSAVSNAICVR